ncbi:GAF domain-containing protein [Candidatus Aerophobetes bacterium]|nr:GAF domain-containing protein [Candidatus Aerophobetes bacterium]
MTDLAKFRKLTEIMHKDMDLDRRMYCILTCATAGHAFGFSRAFLLLVNEKTNVLEGKMGVGPTSQEDAESIWSRMSMEDKSLEELLTEYDKMLDIQSMPLYSLVKKFHIPLSEENELLVRCLKEKQAFKVTTASQDKRVSKEFAELLGVEEFVCIPLVVENEAIGVLLADNRYSWRSISEDDIHSLSFFVQHMAVAIKEARLYQRLSENQKKLREMEKELHRAGTLISLGEVAAHLAHEIRNPLVTIGGFARSIYKIAEGNVNEPQIIEKLIKRAKTIIIEIERLESLLSETLDFVHTSKPVFQLKDLNEVVEEISDLIEEELKSKNIKLLCYLSPLPYIRIDEDQIKQVLFNLIQNAIDSMPQGGKLHIKTEREKDFVKMEVTDTGQGIPADIKDEIFSPFFTTKTHGSGLGLSIVKHIAEQHGGRVKLKSRENKETSFIVYLPVPISEN